MSIIKRDKDRFPFFPSIFDDFFGRDIMDWRNFNFSNTNTTLPAVNVKEDEKKFTIEVAAPGLKKDDFKIRIENDKLIISSERKEHKEDKEEGKYSRREFSYQSFQRSFNIPASTIRQDKIEAEYCNGILCIDLPKNEEAISRFSREIKIK